MNTIKKNFLALSIITSLSSLAETQYLAVVGLDAKFRVNLVTEPETPIAINDINLTVNNNDVFEDGVDQTAFGTFSANNTSSVTASSSYGTINISENNWTYSLNNSDPFVQSRFLNELVYDTITFTSDESSKTLDIELYGENDPAIITTNATDQYVTEDLDADAEGTISITDVDNGEGSIFSITSNHGSVNVSGGNWYYTLIDSPAIQSLKSSDLIVDPVTFTTDDGTTKIQNVYIVGDDDVSVITIVTSDTYVKEDVDLTATGTAVMFGETITATTDFYGSVTMDGDVWTYTLNNSFVQNWRESDTYQMNITFTGSGGSTKVQQITADGSNDLAAITINPDATFVHESDPYYSGQEAVSCGDNAQTTTGTVDIVDPDGGEGFLVSATANYGMLSISGSYAYTYTVACNQFRDNFNAVNALNDGDQIIDVITFTTDNNQVRTLNMTIKGVTD